MIQNFFSKDQEQEKSGVCQLSSNNLAQENLIISGTWNNNQYKGKTHTGQDCIFIGVTYPFVAAPANADKLEVAKQNFNIIPMYRKATTYELELQKIFSEDKISLDIDTYKMKAYQKDIGDF
jgi:hypothetical protein